MTGLWQTVANNKQNPFFGYHFHRLNADRDIVPESSIGSPLIAPNGKGATTTIFHFRNNVKRDNRLVEERMLNDLNTIFAPDATFTKIDTREDGPRWEIYLDDDQRRRIPVSRSGSGLKTIILVLAYLHLIPQIENYNPATYLYGFEELENNLHPALHRRLLHFLHEHSRAVGCRFFLTTHSAVEIDFFARDPGAQLLHVTHDGTNATVTTISGYGQGRRILDDLDLRASDILQANGIIWVEGPSDRIYLNKWIELWTNSELREGAHYQILFYGGKLLAHLDAQDPDNATATIHVLTANRNAAILIDSDKAHSQATISGTKQRLHDEVTRSGGYAWITDGREIENYLPPDLLTSTTHLSVAPGPYDDVQAAIKENAASPARFADKVKLAQAIAPHLTREHLSGDLASQIDTLVNHVKRWNGT